VIARRFARIGLAMVLATSLIAALVVVLQATAHNRIHVVGYFANSNGLFAGDEVRILGIPVGEIDTIEPELDRVKISFWYDEKYKVPADAKAAVLSPSLVTSRAIQLTPAYNGGPTLQNHAVLPLDRTAVPVEWDDFRTQLEKLTESMQPTEPGGVSAFGAWVNTVADNLRGQGTNIRDMVIKLSQSLSALGDHSGDIFATVKNLSILVSALHESADLMEQLNQNLAATTALVANDPNEVGQAMADLHGSVDDVTSFVADNRDPLGTTTDRLAAISTALVQSMDDIKQTLHVGPTAFQNYVNIYEPAHAASVGAIALNNFSNPITFICGAIQAASRLGAEQASKLCVQYLAPIIKNRQYNFPPLGFNFIVGPKARPNEITYSEDWLRPDYVPPAVPNPGTPSAAPPLDQETPPPPGAPLAAETPDVAVATNPAEGLPGMMMPHGGGS
jgi:phospholipid/cholesterol/gamma-HCH transport system substrate-binding protein